MTRSLLLLSVILFTKQVVFAQQQKPEPTAPQFSADTVKRTIDEIVNELSLKHPGFYRYNSKEAFTEYIDSIKYTIKDSLTTVAAFLKLKPIISKIHCLHTELSLAQSQKDMLHQRPTFFPFQLYFENDKAYVVKNYSNNPAIVPGDELVSINGNNIASLLKQLLPLIPADGYNLTMKYRALFYQFPSWYNYLDPTEKFTTVVKKDNQEATYSIKGARYNDIAEEGFLKEPVLPKQLAFKIENNTGLLTIHSFAKSDIKRGGQDFKKFIDQAFLQLKEKNIQHLVVDLRDNTGGSDPNAAYFTSHFFDQPFRYWDRIEVTEPIAKDIKGVMLTTFYKKPVQKDSVWLWQKARYVRDFDFYEEQAPAKNNYKGKAYILINGFCMSSCADVAAILSHHKKAIFIGEETGGGYQGNTSGMMPESKVLPFHFTLTVPLQKYYNAVDPLKNIGRGTIPDHPINMTIDDIINKQDRSLLFALDLIKNDFK